MIIFENISAEAPYKRFENYYNNAEKNNQNYIEAISISSFSKEHNEVNSRYVNLKYIKGNEWIFFSNYDSPKSNEFKEHDQICATFFWNQINVQIRIKAKINKTDENFSDLHYAKRSKEKNILAHSSNQSEIISSYEEVKDKYTIIKSKEALIKSRPKNWGGFSFIPYYFEFWEGHKNRLNKRECYSLIQNEWKKNFLSP